MGEAGRGAHLMSRPDPLDRVGSGFDWFVFGRVGSRSNIVIPVQYQRQHRIPIAPSIHAMPSRIAHDRPIVGPAQHHPAFDIIQV